MAKDPAFLFYPGDWLGGTTTLTRAHKGAYMDLLMAQFSCGHMSLEDIKFVLGPDYDSMWENKLKSKFKEDENGKFYNEKLENEVVRRKNFTESRRKNLSHVRVDMEDHMDQHMETETGNETIIETKGVQVEERKVLFKNSAPGKSVESLIEHMKKYSSGKYMKYDMDFYYNQMLNWSNSGGNKKIDWRATCATFINRDVEKNSAKMAKVTHAGFE